MEKRYFCFECGTNVIEDKMENRIAGWFGICKRCSNNSNNKVAAATTSTLTTTIRTITIIGVTLF